MAGTKYLPDPEKTKKVTVKRKRSKEVNDTYACEYEHEHDYLLEFAQGVVHLCQNYRNGFVFCGLSIELPATAIVRAIFGAEPAFKFGMYNTLVIWVISLICILVENAAIEKKAAEFEEEKLTEEVELFAGDVVTSLMNGLAYEIAAFIQQDDGSSTVIVKCLTTGEEYTIPEQAFETLFTKEECLTS